MEYQSGENCPECGVPERWVHRQEYVAGHGWKHAFTYSCSHFEQRSVSPCCKYCGKPDTPVRQVPVPGVPFSDCYCDDCVEKCAAEYGGRPPC